MSWLRTARRPSGRSRLVPMVTRLLVITYLFGGSLFLLLNVLVVGLFLVALVFDIPIGPGGLTEPSSLSWLPDPWLISALVIILVIDAVIFVPWTVSRRRERRMRRLRRLRRSQ